DYYCHSTDNSGDHLF
nr:immunoglobulin light chain junction region [Macaca mulatta]